MLRGSPTIWAKSLSMWIGLKSPDAPAYRCGRYLSGVTRSSEMESPWFRSDTVQTPRTMFVHVPRTTSSPSWLTETDSKT